MHSYQSTFIDSSSLVSGIQSSSEAFNFQPPPDQDLTDTSSSEDQDLEKRNRDSVIMVDESKESITGSTPREEDQVGNMKEPKGSVIELSTGIPPVVSIRNTNSEVLKALTCMNKTCSPLVQLNEYYQKKGFKSITDSFYLESKTIKEASESMTKWGLTVWRFTFLCPMTREDITPENLNELLRFHSYDQNDDNENEENADDELVTFYRRLFGKSTSINGRIFFFAKKSAKKCAAIATLATRKDDIFGHSKNPSKSTAMKQADASHRASKSKPRKIPSKFPEWVQELRQAGVDGLVISYKEQLVNAVGWRAQPSQIRCRLSITGPKILEVVGEPSCSKVKARDSAVSLCIEELRRQSKLWQTDAMDNMDLLQCDEHVTNFVYPIPTWAQSPVTSNKEVFLYELELLTSCGKPVACKDLSITPGDETRFGIIFAQDIEPISRKQHQQQSHRQGFDAPFRFKGGTKDLFHAKLRKRTALVLSLDSQNEQAADKDSLELIQKFNHIVARWKSYGLANESVAFNCSSGSSRGETDGSELTRGYLFVPLVRSHANDDSVEIDWNMLRDICTKKITPYLVSGEPNVQLPFLGHVRVSLICAAIILGASSSFVKVTKDYAAITSSLGDLPITLWGSILVLSVVIFISRNLPPRKTVPESKLRNCFLRQKARPSSVYLSRSFQKDRLTSKSFFRSPTARGKISQESIEYNKKNFGLDILNATFEDFYRKRHGIRIKYKAEKLVAANEVTKHVDENPLEGQRSEKLSFSYLVPELIDVLPLPRDTAYLLGKAERFMPALERQITLGMSCRTMEEMGRKTKAIVSNGFTPSVPTKQPHRQRVLSSLLDEATTVYPCNLYERLELLGDAVLGYFLALNASFRNSSLGWDYDDLAQMTSEAGKNTSLVEGALRMGLSRLLIAGKTPWRGPFAPVSMKRRSRSAMTEKSMFGYFSDGQAFPIADSTLSDVAESLLGAVYLHGMGSASDPTGAGIVVALLELLSLPMPFGDCAGRANLSWFRARGPCLKGGYPFDLDRRWLAQFQDLESVVNEEPTLVRRLEQGYKLLLQKLGISLHDQEFVECLGKKPARLLLMAALFDDDLSGRQPQDVDEMDQESLAQTTSSQTVDGLCQIAMLRDTIHHVGAHALHLRITEEIFRMYPGATVGDIHLMRSCATSHDVVVYVMIKANLHETLFDTEAECVLQFLDSMSVADCIGRKKWNECNGWAVPGGVKEFDCRHRTFFSETRDHDLSSIPQYPGLCGGRLWGQSAKMEESITGDLHFSFKTIIGALTLSLGIEGMWRIIAPLFEELLLLSAEELRTSYRGVSSICKSYSSGKKLVDIKSLR